jgi:hypothetical protein
MSSSQNLYNRMPGQPGRGNFGKTLVYIFLLSMLAVIVYRYFQNRSTADTTTVPREVTLNYVPSDFKPDIDEENALAILSNPHRYRREFDDLVAQVNVQLIRHVANRMGLADDLKDQAVRTYRSDHHPYLRELYFKDFVALKDTSSQLYQLWYENEFSNAVALLNEVAAKYTCFFINQIFATLLKTEEGKIYVKGKAIDTPCGLALGEGLAPMVKRLQDRAAIEDFSKSKGIIQERVEQVIAELATMEVRDQKGLSRQMQTKLFGFPISSTDVEVSAISILKVGFKLDRYLSLDLDSETGTVTVNLPEPEILSHEVYPKIDKLDIGWLREVQSVDLNKNFNSLRDAFRQDALESDIFEKSKKHATELMQNLLTPTIKSLSKRYRVQVKYKKIELQTLPEAERKSNLKNLVD